jgi:O-succinylbenzoic acid--CoA ligase
MPNNIFFINASEETIHHVKLFLAEWNSPSRFIETATSGSTGIPKIIRIEKEAMRISAKKTLSYLAIQRGETALLCLSPETIGGKMMLVRALVGELTLFVTSPTSAPLTGISERINFAAMVPLQLHETVKNAPEKLREIRHCIIGGGAVSEVLIKEMNELKISVFHTFGMTETISHVALRKIGYVTEEIYTAMDGISFSEENGHLVIHYPEIGLARLVTNDEVRIHSSTQFEWLGRTDFTINSGGVKLHPEVIERTLSAVLSMPFFISSLPDERFGNKLILLVEGIPDSTLNKAFFTPLLPPYSIPKEIYFLPVFIRTESGKIHRSANLTMSHSNAIKKVL